MTYTHKNSIFHSLIFLLISLFISLPQELQAQQSATNYQQARASTPQKWLMAGKYAQYLFFNQEESEAVALLIKNVNEAIKHPDGQYAAYLYSILAINKRILDQNAESKRYLSLAKNYGHRSNDAASKGYVNYAEGWIYVRNEQPADAVRSFLVGLNWYEKAPNTEVNLLRKSALLKELTSIYAVWKTYDLQEKYSRQALDIAQKLQNPSATFDAYMQMGYLYEQQFFEANQTNEKRDLAENYYSKAIEIFQQNEQELSIPSNLSYAAINLANLYLNYYPKSERPKVLHFANLALEIAQETQQYSQVASAYGMLAELEIENKNSEQAKSYLIAGLAALHKDPVVNQNIVMSIYQNISELMEREGNFKEALAYHKLYTEAFSLVYDSEKMEQGRRLESQFEKERQEQRLMLMQLEGEKKENQISLMNVQAMQQNQQLQNMRLNEENQKKVLELAHLEVEKHNQELKLSRLETKQRAQEVMSYQKEIGFKEKQNTNYALLAAAFFLLLLLLLYAYFQRSKGMRQQQELHVMALEKEKQKSKISNLTAMLDGQEKERGRLARDLHDGLGGLLSSTKINLSHALNKLETKEKHAMTAPLGQLDLAVNELRRVAHNLMPDLLLKYGLEEALMDYATRMSNTEVEVSVHCLHYQKNIAQEQQLLVYRIIQELVNNALKHAKASQILIQLVEEAENIFVTVEDNGMGFDKDKINLQHSAGLHNIATRVKFLKGKMNVQTEINLGTTIEFDFPKTQINT